MNYFLLKAYLKLTAELVKIAKSLSKQTGLRKVNSNSAQALICHYFPTKYSAVTPAMMGNFDPRYVSIHIDKDVQESMTSNNIEKSFFFTLVILCLKDIQ